ncbi:MAG: sodium/proline symporter [Planctomycetota bacterium]|jgi:sodium/proline symporter
MVFTVSFAVYTLLIVAVGLYSARFVRHSDEDYFLAGRSLGPWVAALSASASSESGWVTLGLVGWAFVSGPSAFWIIPGCVLGFLFNWFVIAGRLRDRAAAVGALTVPDFFALHFRERVPVLRLLSVIVILVAMLLYVAAQFAAAGKAFAAGFDDLPYQAGVLIGAGIVLVYTVLGGFRAACWTDFVQGLIMVGTLIIFPAYLLMRYGGYGFVETNLEAVDPGLLSFWPQKTGAALVGFLLGAGALGINLGYPGQPHVLVRFMALRDRREARLGGLISAAWATCVYWGAVTVGLMVRALTEAHHAGAADAAWSAPLHAELAAGASGPGETGLVLAARHMIPGVMSGMVLAAVLAAICSTADSQLVVAASSAATDVYSRLIDRSRRLAHLLINRTVMLVLGVIAVLLVINEELEVYRYVLTYGWAVLGASFGPQLILALFWRRASYAGCVAGMTTGFALALIWPQVYDATETGVEIYNLPLAFGAAAIVNVLVSLVFGAPPARE